MMKRPLIYLLIFFTVCPLNATLKAQGTFEVKQIQPLSEASDDIVSFVTGNGICFFSNRKTNPFITRENLQNERIYELYYSSFNGKEDPGEPSLFSNDITGKFNVGSTCISPDGNTLYFTRNYVEGKSRKRNGDTDKYGIFIAHKKGNEWVDISEFEYNDHRYRLADPFISQDGRYLYFSSDMPGTLGKSDIFVSENIDGKWSKPVNLGPQINSTASELYPAISNNGRLYFSSDRKGGPGGLDIYYSVFSKGKWNAPELLPDPINSANDDFAMYFVPGQQNGYFSSDRRVRGDADIYSFRSTIIRWDYCDTLQKNSYCYEFVEETALANDSLSMEYKWEWDFDDGQKEEGIKTSHCFPGPGKYYVQLNFINKITGKIEKNQASYTLEIEDVRQPYIIAPDTVMTGEDVRFNASKTNLPGWKISGYYWNFDDETIGNGIDVNKKFSREGKYNVQLIVSTPKDESGSVKETCVCKDIIVKERNK